MPIPDPKMAIEKNISQNSWAYIVIKLAMESMINAEAPIILDGTLDTNNPPAKLAIPAHTASKAVANETKVGSNPRSINAGILCSANVKIAKFKIEKAIVKSHSEGVFNALFRVNEYSFWSASSNDCADKFDFPSGRRPMSSGCRLTNIIDMGHTKMIPKIPKIIQVDSHE